MHIFQGPLGRVLASLGDAARVITKSIHTTGVGKAGTQNVYGEEQLALDVMADQIIQDHMKDTGLVGLLASEELPEALLLPGGPYAVAYDPLDGSSLVDVNLSVGTIFGIYEGNNFIGQIPRNMVAAGFFVYGPRTTWILSCGEGVHHLVLSSDGEWVLDQENIQVGEGKMFAPGNLRAASDRDDYFKLVQWWIREGYTLRYSGGMVPDINQILLKRKGIFTYPGYSEAPQGKLRLLFECGPMAYVMEKAGGAASDGYGPILDRRIEALAQRSPIYIGSKGEVKRCEQLLVSHER